MTRSNHSPRAKAVMNVCWKYVPKPAISPPIQQKHLYTPIWTSAHDQCFIDALWDKAMAGCSDVDSFNNIESIKYATTVVNLVMKEAFTVDANCGRYIKLRERYETFSYLISQPEIHWDRWENTMHAPTEFWQRMFERFPLAKAYEHFGEPNYIALRAIFEGCVPHGAGPSRRGWNNEVIDVDAIVEVSSGSDEN
ncbi:hypothetical protein Salat_2429800 [Sesamum alatum]|uniref:Myb/SANT-like domain-containing protein n=1 Tax=Sesamum alatum TaxID=300844 RepID=A0AAE2CFF3_9LAMI|nr:hypothetical protein Salat_2429800 [Sesamum alatum]